MPDGDPSLLIAAPCGDVILCEVVALLLRQCIADRHLKPDEQAAAAQYAVAGHLDFVRSVSPLIVHRLRSTPIAPGSVLESVLQHYGATPGPALDRLVSAISATPGAAMERLGLALKDLENGKVGAMLTPVPSTADTPDKTGKKRGKRPPLSAKVQQIRAEVAGALQLLYEAGSKLEDAAERAANELKNHPILADVDGQHWRAILNWRSDVREGAGDAAHYNSFVSMAKNLVRARDGTSADLDKIAIGHLKRLQKP